MNRADEVTEAQYVLDIDEKIIINKLDEIVDSIEFLLSSNACFKLGSYVSGNICVNPYVEGLQVYTPSYWSQGSVPLPHVKPNGYFLKTPIGCSSERKALVEALSHCNIQAEVAESYGDIFVYDQEELVTKLNIFFDEICSKFSEIMSAQSITTIPMAGVK